MTASLVGRNRMKGSRNASARFCRRYTTSDASGIPTVREIGEAVGLTRLQCRNI